MGKSDEAQIGEALSHDAMLADIVNRLERIEALLSRLTGLALPPPAIHPKNPMALAHQLAREGRREESIAEARRVTAMIRAQEREQKRAQKEAEKKAERI